MLAKTVQSILHALLCALQAAKIAAAVDPESRGAVKALLERFA